MLLERDVTEYDGPACADTLAAIDGLPRSHGWELADTTHVSCAMPGCGSSAGVFRPDGVKHTVKRAREIAYLNGWVQTDDGTHLCPLCAASGK